MTNMYQKRKGTNPKRIVGYLDPELRKRLKEHLAQKRVTYSAWLSRAAKKEVGE